MRSSAGCLMSNEAASPATPTPKRRYQPLLAAVALIALAIATYALWPTPRPTVRPTPLQEVVSEPTPPSEPPPALNEDVVEVQAPSVEAAPPAAAEPIPPIDPLLTERIDAMEARLASL